MDVYLLHKCKCCWLCDCCITEHYHISWGCGCWQWCAFHWWGEVCFSEKLELVHLISKTTSTNELSSITLSVSAFIAFSCLSCYILWWCRLCRWRNCKTVCSVRSRQGRILRCTSLSWTHRRTFSQTTSINSACSSMMVNAVFDTLLQLSILLFNIS